MLKDDPTNVVGENGALPLAYHGVAAFSPHDFIRDQEQSAIHVITSLCVNVSDGFV